MNHFYDQALGYKLCYICLLGLVPTDGTISIQNVYRSSHYHCKGLIAIKGYLRCKTITSQNVPPKLCSVLEIFKFFVFLTIS